VESSAKRVSRLLDGRLFRIEPGRAVPIGVGFRTKMFGAPLQVYFTDKVVRILFLEFQKQFFGVTPSTFKIPFI
jgi:hypothetical protein